MSRPRSISATRRPRSRARGGERASRTAGAPVLIRAATPADAGAIARVSALDERALPDGKRLVGVLDGRVVAAVEIASGRAVADPFVPTSAVVELLGLRAAQVLS